MLLIGSDLSGSTKVSLLGAHSVTETFVVSSVHSSQEYAGASVSADAVEYDTIILCASCDHDAVAGIWKGGWRLSVFEEEPTGAIRDFVLLCSLIDSDPILVGDQSAA